ncbi:nematocin receptor 2-like [Pecten maximus]|uniref:nematocin receptor 2-like n=1 Tax=Pecten maximus TaxID=6579 RepID=UPI001458F562|nr:nematocin receptor 2-like [Pecten maximus]
MANDSAEIAASTLLWLANEKEVDLYYPAIVFTGFMTILGLLGNGFVIYVYGYRFRKTCANVYIFWLSVIDLVCCVLGIPFDIFQLRFPLLYGDAIPCKLFSTVSIVAYASQTLLLLCISRDRYYKICHPLKSFRFHSPHKNVAYAFILALCISWPSVFVHGTKTIKMATPGIVATTCSIDDSIDRLIPVLYFGFYLILAFADFVVLLFVYINIIRVVYRRSRYNLRESTETLPKVKPYNLLSGAKRTRSTGEVFATELSLNCSQHTASGSNEQRKNLELQKIAQVSKTTIIFLLVAVSFVFSYVPYLTIELVLNLDNKIDFRKQSIHVQQLIEVASMAFCIGNVSNPIIYGIFNPNFRHECCRLFSRQIKAPAVRNTFPVSRRNV